MRKILAQVALDPKTFAPIATVIVKNPDGTKKVYKQEFDAQKNPLNKYTAEQQRHINGINYLLAENNEPPMTQEEMDWAVDPYGQIAIESKTTERELQSLSGFRVEKQILPFPGENN